MTALLLSHPHNYSEALEHLDRPIVPRRGKRAIDYIQSHLESVITLGDVVAAWGVPGPTLLGTSRIIEAYRRSAICGWHASREFEKRCSMRSRKTTSPRSQCAGASSIWAGLRSTWPGTEFLLGSLSRRVRNPTRSPESTEIVAHGTIWSR